jgi:hypothetical protein
VGLEAGDCFFWGSWVIISVSWCLCFSVLLIAITLIKCWQLQNLTVRILNLIANLGGLCCGLTQIVVIIVLFAQVVSFEVFFENILRWSVWTQS